MSKKFEFTSVLVKGAFNGTYAQFPFDSRKEFGTGRAVRVNVTFDGHPYNMNLLPNGDGGHWLHLKKEIRDVLGKQEGDDVDVTLVQDFSKPKIEIPEYLAWLLNEDNDMKKLFEKMSFSSRKFWVNFIEEPKNNKAKAERVAKLFEFLERNHSGK